MTLIAGVLLVGLAAIEGRDRAPRGDGLVAADVDRDTPVPQPAALPADLDLEPGRADVAQRSGVPARALRAYGAAEIAQRAATPDCRLSWTTLAGIGRVESDHGRLGRADLDADGVARPPIIGVPLDGSRGMREIRDTDGGRLDGDPTYDRAVGPMQFLPDHLGRSTAPTATATGCATPTSSTTPPGPRPRYLCADDRDTASGEGWWDGVLAYNRSAEYARLVWAAADRYATPPAS